MNTQHYRIKFLIFINRTGSHQKPLRKSAPSVSSVKIRDSDNRNRYHLVKVCGVGYVFVCFRGDVLSNASWKSRKLDTTEAFRFNSFKPSRSTIISRDDLRMKGFIFIVKPENKRALWKTQNTSPPLARFGTSPFSNV